MYLSKDLSLEAFNASVRASVHPGSTFILQTTCKNESIIDVAFKTPSNSDVFFNYCNSAVE